MSETCRWIHEQLEQLPLIIYSFELDKLPDNGIYFFYEDGELWGQGGNKPRIVRIGTHRDGNFRSRISERFLLKESKMNFDLSKPAPHEGSIFRKNIGRALLNKANDGYQLAWEIDFTLKENREISGHLRNIEEEKRIESEITNILREDFLFKFIVLKGSEIKNGLRGT